MSYRRATLTLLALVLFCPATNLSAQRAAVEAPHGIVTSVHALASEAGVSILRQGGNAIDAAVATGLALSVVYPFAGNISGGGFMLIHLADGRDLVIDYRETAPAAASRDMYLGPDGKLKKGEGSSTQGWRSSGVPGTIAGFGLAVERYGSGRVSWAEICEPARRLAEEGHVISQGTAANFKTWEKFLSQSEATKEIYLRDGKLWQAGEKFVQRDLGETLARLQKDGPREFYEGETARRISEAMATHGGSLSAEDLKNYQPIERPALRGSYRGYDIATVPLPSSGGLTLLEMLGMLETRDVRALGQNSAAKYHLFIEVMKRAFRDRAEYPADPAFVEVPVASLLSTEYLRRRISDFSPDHTTPADLVVPGLGQAVVHAPREKNETTHFGVIDAAGNAVVNTYTLNGAYGSGVTIPGTGILMNNEMDDFTTQVGASNLYGLIQGEANAIVPGKRPVSSMTPTFVFKNGKLILGTGSPGGPTITTTVLQIISNVVDFDVPLMAAVEAPRIHHQWMPDIVSFERYGMSIDTRVLLEQRGHKLHERESYEGAYQGDGETVGIDPSSGSRLGAADPRKPDSRAIGY